MYQPRRYTGTEPPWNDDGPERDRDSGTAGRTPS